MESLVTVIALLFAAALTPGPNNFLVMSAGARGGLARAFPLIVGVVAGGLVLLALAWTGVSGALAAEPRLRMTLTMVGAGYLIWLGGRQIGNSRRASVFRGDGVVSALPATWPGVAAFQFLNPKAWLLLMTATAAMSRDFQGLAGFAVLAAIYTVRSVLTLSLWALAGSTLERLLADGPSKRVFEATMGGLLVASAALLVVGGL